ncbi:LPS translocon maturation chaperone LptM [Noviherbaspirillum saxi]|uniref:LPS translocon maturation chaperone LptM n=1 Tax=Noviherbaspirillum saxi TaxID=2320863 RepID=UPI002368A303|nr:lipoprotein [Noviherbaspirillum saxi]
MKSAQHYFVATAVTCMLAGCGQKGPLYLPAKPAPVAAPVQQTPPAPPSTSQ